MNKFKAIKDDQLYLLPPSIEDFVPASHLARVIDEIVEGLDTSSIEERYSEIGQKSYHPKILLKLLIYGYSTGVVSGRKMATKCESDTAYMFLASMYRPDFRTINDFRKDNAEYFKKCFVDVIKVCQQLQMVRVGTIAFDSTKILANVSAKNTKDKAGYEQWLIEIDQQIQRIITRAEEVNHQEDKEHGNLRGDELPKELRQKERLKSKIQQVLTRIKEAEKINLTDNDAHIMKDKTGFNYSYNCQAGTTLDGIIVSAFATTSAGDKVQLLPLIEQTEQNTNEKITNALADSGYASYQVYERLEEKNITAYIPDQQYNQQEKRNADLFDRSNFTYDEQNDTYICPQGKELHFERVYQNKKKHQKSRLYSTSECLTCPLKSQCTKGNKRYINRELREPLREKVRQRLNTPEGKALYRKRMQTIEPIWGNLKENKKIRRFNLRGKEKVNAEFLLHCLSHNITKIYKHKTAA